MDPPEQRSLPCWCGKTAQYKEQRPKPVLTVVGPVSYQRPYYVCAHCHHAPNPADAALGVEHEEFSPGVRRMMAVLGSEGTFGVGREQLQVLAGLRVSTKSVERQAERIGAEIIEVEQAEIQRSVQLQLPIPLGPPIPVLYVEIDGTGIPVVKKETEGRSAVWIWNLAAEQFPGAMLIVDFYHASDHLHKLSRLLFPANEQARRR